MKNTLMFKRLLMVAIALAFAAPAWAAIVPCPGSPTSLAGIPVTPPNGCTSGNDQFSNFVVTSPTTGTINGVTLPTPSSTAAAWPSAPDATTINLNSAAGGGMNLTTPGFCGTPTASITPSTFCIGGGPAPGVGYFLTTSITYELAAIAGSISELELDGTVVSHSSGQSGATAVVFREFCLGATTFSQSCSDYGVLQIGAVNGKFTTLSQTALETFSGVTQIAIRDTIFLQVFSPTGEWAGIESFDLFVPEPATFGLVGLALAGLGAVRFRKRKL